MKCVEIEVLSETTNSPVFKAPGRKFPGVLIQGDSLKSLLGMVEDIEDACQKHDEAETDEAIAALKAKLAGYLAEYEEVMHSHGLELPYSK
jgi:hypothetical protein